MLVAFVDSVLIQWYAGIEATIIDGKTVADGIKQVLATNVELMRKASGKVPGLAVIVVGTRKDSELYVHNKTVACIETGIASSCTKLPEHVSEEEVIAIVKKYNNDPSMDGILVQLPLPQVILGFQYYLCIIVCECA